MTNECYDQKENLARFLDVWHVRKNLVDIRGSNLVLI